MTVDPTLQAFLDAQGKQQQSQDKTQRPVRRYIRGSVGNLGTGATTILTCPALTYAKVDSISVNNPTAGSLLLTLYVVPAGSSAGATNELASTVNFATLVNSGTVNGATDVLPLGMVLGPGDTIQGKGDSAGLNVWISAEVVEPGPGQ